VIYPHLVTLQQPTSSRTPSGGVTQSYAPISGLTDLPARIIPEQVEDANGRMIVDIDRFTVIVQGDREIERPMRLVSDYLDAVLGVVKVQRPVLYGSPLTNATIVTAERVTA
jgi:hypothetical protein